MGRATTSPQEVYWCWEPNTGLVLVTGVQGTGELDLGREVQPVASLGPRNGA